MTTEKRGDEDLLLLGADLAELDAGILGEWEGVECERVDLGSSDQATLAAFGSRRFQHVLLVADSITDARAALHPSALVGQTRRLTLRIGRVCGELIAPPSWPRGDANVIQLDWHQDRRESGSTALTCSLHVGQDTAVSTLLAICLGGPRSIRWGPGSLGRSIGLHGRGGEAWVVGTTDVRYVDNADIVYPPGGDIPSVDLVMSDAPSGLRFTRPDDEGARSSHGDRLPVVELKSRIQGASLRGPTWQDLEFKSNDWNPLSLGEERAELLPPVDAKVVNPIGFGAHRTGTVSAFLKPIRNGPDLETGVVRDDGTLDMTIRSGTALNHKHIAQLRQYTFLQDYPVAHYGPVEQARFLIQICAAGIPVVSRSLPSTVGSLIGSQLVTELDRDPSPLCDELEREKHSVRVRRLALLQHAPTQRISELIQKVSDSRRVDPCVSVIVATNRPRRIRHVISQVQQQEYRNIELVLALHGDIFNKRAVQQLLDGCDMPTRLVTAPAAAVLGEVLNLCINNVSGEYIVKLDDDDWYSRHHVLDLVLGSQYSDATLVGKGGEFVYLNDLDITVRRASNRSESYSNHVAGSTMFISRSDLEAIGGWRPVHRAVDRSMLHSVRSLGGSIYRIHGLGYLVNRHGRGHTWDVGWAYFLRPHDPQWRGVATNVALSD